MCHTAEETHVAPSLLRLSTVRGVYEVCTRYAAVAGQQQIDANQELRCRPLTHNAAAGGNYGSILLHSHCCHKLRQGNLGQSLVTGAESSIPPLGKAPLANYCGSIFI